MRVINLLQETVERYPDKLFCVDIAENREITYRNFYYQVKNYATILHESGITNGDRIGIFMVNSYLQLIAFFSVLYLGAIPILIDDRYTIREVKECLIKSDASCFIMRQGNKTDSFLSDFSVSGICKKIIIISQEKIPLHDTMIINIVEGQERENLLNINDDGAGAIILFTYRGLGTVIPVVLSEDAICYSVTSNNILTEIDSSLCIALFLPVSHIFALTTNVLSPLSVGGTIIIITDMKPLHALKYFNQYKINFIIAVPTLIKVFLHSLKKGKLTVPYLKYGIVGGASYSKELCEEWNEVTGSLVVQGYGLTETCPVIANQWRNHNGSSIGLLMYGADAKVVNEVGELINDTQPGELWIKTKSLMTGYYNDVDTTGEFLVDGWFNTGDIVKRDADGFFYFVRRNKKIAKIGGATVDLVEIGNVLNYNINIDEVVLDIQDDALWQEKIVCTVKTSLDRIQILNYLKENLASYKIPKVINIEN